MLPTPPPCPDWCDTHDESTSAEWDVHPSAITHLCRRVVSYESPGGHPLEVALERFAEFDGRTIRCSTAMLRINGCDAMPLHDALMVVTAVRDLVRATLSSVAA